MLKGPRHKNRLTLGAGEHGDEGDQRGRTMSNDNIFKKITKILANSKGHCNYK